MIFKLLNSLLTNDTSNASETDAVDDKITLLNQISNSSGEYALVTSTEANQKEKNKKAQEMLSIISSIEKDSTELKNSNLFYAIAIAYRNYCAWFVQGNERKYYLRKCVFFLEQSISTQPDNTNAKSELGHLLIEEKVIRELSRGISILEDLNNTGIMPSYLNSTLLKARRQSGDIEHNNKFNLCDFKDPSPAVFREERKRFRALIREYKKQNDIERLKTILNQYYNLAVLVTIFYGDHDCNSGVIGWQYDEAKNTIKNVCDKIDYSFATHGYLEQSNFISRNDWKVFVNIFGEVTYSFNPAKEFKK